MKGSACRCGFTSVVDKITCPSCGREMTLKEFPDIGKVVSYVKLDIPPMNTEKAMNLAMVEIEYGPSIVCWTDQLLEVGHTVRVSSKDGSMYCTGA